MIDIIERLDFYDKLDPSTPQGQGFQKALASDADCKHMRPPAIDPGRATQLKAVLTKPLYAEAFAEYERLRRQGRRYPHWYEFYGGHRSLGGLADHLNHKGAYEVLYGGWSATSHGGDAVRRILTEGDDGGPAVWPIRNPSEIATVVNLAVTFTLDAIRLISRKYRSGEERSNAEWYVKDVRERWFAVDGIAAPSVPSRA